MHVHLSEGGCLIDCEMADSLASLWWDILSGFWEERSITAAQATGIISNRDGQMARVIQRGRDVLEKVISCNIMTYSIVSHREIILRERQNITWAGHHTVIHATLHRWTSMDEKIGGRRGQCGGVAGDIVTDKNKCNTQLHSRKHSRLSWQPNTAVRSWSTHKEDRRVYLWYWSCVSTNNVFNQT